MPIGVKQIGAIANAVINSYLEKGTVPSVRSVISGVYAALNNRASGNPVTVFKPVPANKTADPAANTALVTNVQSDIGNLYNENIDQVNRIIRDFDYKQTFRERIAQRIVSLTAQLNQASVNNASLIQGKIDSFDQIDFLNTTAYCNFRELTVELPAASNLTTKIDLSAASVSYSTDGQTNSVLGTPVGATSDSQNEAFFVTTSTSAPSATLTFTIVLPHPQLISKVAVTAHAGAPVTIGCQLDSQILVRRNVDISSTASWELSATNVSKIIVTMTKSTADGSAGGLNLFDFGLRNISLYSQEYASTAAFTTVPLDFDHQPIGTVVLSADQELPPNTNVAWSVSTLGPQGPFFALMPGGSLTFATLGTIDSKRTYPVRSVNSSANVVQITNGTISGAADAGLSVSAPIRGGRTPLFALCRVAENVQPGNVTVLRGRNAWKVSSYHYSVDNHGIVTDPLPTIADFSVPRGTNPQIFTRFQPAEFDVSNQYPGINARLASALRLPAIEYPFNSSTDRVMSLFEAYLTIDSTLAPSVLASLNQTQVSVPSVFAAGRAALYVNGNLVSVTAANNAGLIQYSAVMPLNPGRNVVQLVTNNYFALGGASFDIGTALFAGLCVDGGQVAWYAEAGPMTEIDIFELQYQTSRNDFSRYALIQDPTGSQQLLVVRELPTTVYDVVTTGIVTPNAPTSLILKADLSGSPVQPSLTPKITAYQLSMSYGAA